MNPDELSFRIAEATQRVWLGDWGCIELVLLQGLPSAEEIAELADSWLLPEELERAARFVAPRDQLRFRWRRLALRSILAERFEVQPKLIRYSVGRWGKPSLTLQDSSRPSLWWNLSDSDDAVVIALTEAGLVGVDIERHRAIRELDSLAQSIMHPEEWAAWCGLPETNRRTSFFHLWSAKEAVVKCVGYGLSVPPKELRVGLFSPTQSPIRADLRGPDGKYWNSQVRVLDLCKEFSIAVAGANHANVR